MDISNNPDKMYIIKTINHIPLFASMNIHEQNLVISKCTQRSYGADETIFEEGGVGDRMYAILQGQVLVSKKSLSEGWKKIFILTPGDVFGEIEILRRINRMPHVRVSTITPCTFLTINAADFLEIYTHFSYKTINDIQLVMEKRLAQIRAI